MGGRPGSEELGQHGLAVVMQAAPWALGGCEARQGGSEGQGSQEGCVVGDASRIAPRVNWAGQSAAFEFCGGMIEGGC